MTIKVYGVPFSVHTRKVIVALRLKGIPYEVVPVVPVNPATLPKDWRRISPTGLIPRDRRPRLHAGRLDRDPRLPGA